MKRIGRLAAYFMALAILLTSILPLYVAAEPGSGSFSLEKLLVDNVENPVGIDNADPNFSWNMISDGKNVSQSAYQLTVNAWDPLKGTEGARVWDSGKVRSDKSVGISYGGEELASSTKYLWRVTVWDKEGASVTSAPASFETGLLEADAFEGVKWIRERKSDDPDMDLEECDKSAYTIEANLKFENAVGLVFAAKDKSHFYMWQLNNKMENNVEGSWLRPHVWNPGGAMYNPEKLQNYNGYKLTEELVNNQLYNLKLVVDTVEKTVALSLDGKEISKLTCADADLTYGKIGFRQATSIEKDQETVWLRDLKATAKDGTVLYSQDYTKAGDVLMDGGTVADGFLRLGSDGENEKVYLSTTKSVEPEYVRYDLDVDVKITSDSAGIVFSGLDGSNFFMWQINGVDHKDEDGKGLLYLRPHIWANGTPHYNFERNISSFFDFEEDILNQEIHVKLEISPENIKTYIKDTLVDTFEMTKSIPGTLADARVGVRSGTGTETFEIDNLKVTSYDREGQATVKFNYDFEDGVSPFGGSAGQASSSQVMNGRYIVSANSGVALTKDLSKVGMPMFRRSFAAEDKEVASAKIYASSLGVYDLYVNGERVGNKDADGEIYYDEMKPGWTDYAKRVLYYTHDVTDLVKQGGNNAIVATVGTGWWTGRVAYGTYGNKDMAFLAKAVITYKDGTKTTIGTDRSWKCSRAGVIREADIWDGETYDANYLSMAEASSPSYTEDESWGGISYSTDAPKALTAQVGQSVQVRKELERVPESTTVYNGTEDNGSDYGKIKVVKGDYQAGDEIQLKKGETVVYDLGQNMVGWPNITVTAPKEARVTMRFAEMLNDSGEKSRGNDGPEGSLYTANYRSALSTGVYVAKGEGRESYHPAFSFYGFRYVSISASADITIHSFKAEVLGSAIPETGKLTTSNKDVNQLISNVLWGQRGNYLSVPTDCPQRDERLGWSGDTQVFVGAASYNANVAGFFHKWGQDARDSQTNDGQYTDVIPRSSVVGAGNTAWGDAGIIVPYTIYKMYGDKQMIREMYTSMEKYMTWLQGRGFQGAGLAYGDWLAYESNDSGTVRKLIACAYYALDARMMSEMAEAIGKSEDAERYAIRYEKIKNYFQKTFLDMNGMLKSGHTTQTCYLMAIKADLFANEGQKQMAIQELVDAIKRNGNKLGTGFVGTGILNQTLSEAGETNMAYTLLLQRDNPSWLYSVDQGATTIWERWNSYTKENGFGDVSMNSFNHYSFGAVVEWMYADMLGITADVNEPGFKHMILKPQPDTREEEEIPENQERITSVKGSYDSAYGLIEAEWKWNKDRFAYTVTVPANTTATLYLPAGESDEITVNEKAVDGLKLRRDGVEFKGYEEGKAVFEVGSGTYAFKALGNGAEDKSALAEASVKVSPDTVALFWDQETALTAEIVSGHDGYGDEMDMKDAAVAFVTDNADVAVVNGNKISARNAGTATIAVTVTLAGKTVTANEKITVRVSETGAVAPVVASKSDTTVTLSSVNGYEYALAAAGAAPVYQKSPQFAGLKAATTYTAYQRIAATSTHKAGTPKSIAVTTDAAKTPGDQTPGTKPGDQTPGTNPPNQGETEVTVASVKLSASKATLGVKEKLQLKATVLPANAVNKKVTWKSSNKKVATVSSAGKVTAKKTGKAVITATAANGKKATCTITVKKAPTSLKISPKSKTLKVGKSYSIKAKRSAKSAGKITYKTSNKKVATVDAKGKVKAKKKGKAVITAKTYNGKKATIKIIVK